LLEESSGMAKKKKTSAIQVPGWLHTTITKYANEHGISQAEASQIIFRELYPEGVLEKPSAPIAPTESLEEEEEETGGESELEEEEPEDVSGELGKTVKDLRTVHTIRALQKGLDKDEEEDWHLTAKDAYEMRKIQAMFGGENPRSQRDERVTQQDLATLQTNILAQMEKMFAEKESESKAAETEFYKKKLEERETADQHAQEMSGFLQPIQEQINILAKSLETLRAELKPESKTTPTSAELEAIRNLGTSIKEAILEMKPKGGAETEKLRDYLDDLTAVLDKINEFSKKGGTPPGEFDWRTAGISTFGEVATEAIRTFGEIEGMKRGSEEETKEEKPTLSKQIIERRVYNYALKKIAAGDLSIDPYKAGEELGLTPNQVWAAVESLRSRGALKAPQVKTSEQKKLEEKAAEVEGGEGEIGPVTEA